jgi:hypothetical protein
MLDITIFLYFSVLVIAPLSFAILGLLINFDHKPRAYRKPRAKKFKRV